MFRINRALIAVLLTAACNTADKMESPAESLEGIYDSESDIAPTPEQLTERILRIFAKAVLSFAQERGERPSSLNQVIAAEPPRPFVALREEWLRDGWGHNIIYSYDDAGFEVRSLGSDGELNTPDDAVITRSWP